MLPAYLDESADSEEEHLFVVAGYLSDLASWTRLQREWTICLSRDPAIPYFHATEMSNKYGNAWTDEQRARRFQEFGEVAKRHVQCGISCAINIPDFKELGARPPWDSPYYTAYYWALNAAVEARQRYPYPPAWRMDIILDENARHQDRALSVFRPWASANDEIARLDHEDDRVVMGLQAADLLAWRSLRLAMDHKHARLRIFAPVEGIYLLTETLEGERLREVHSQAMHSVAIWEAQAQDHSES